jgi:membrane associated rhomboid family serine protease
VKALIWANVGVFLLTAVLEMVSRPMLRLLIDDFALTPQSVLTDLRLWQPATYLFLHGGVSHVLINMLVLWMFGVQLERLWGTRFFVRYYFVAGVGAAMVTIAISLLPFTFSEATYQTPTVGASGAIYGLLMAFALYFPDTPILFFLLFPVPAKYFVLIIGAIDFLYIPRGGNIAYITHLGGLLTGYLYLRRFRGVSIGRLGLMADIKYRYVKWKMNRLRRRFDVYSGDQDRDWNDRLH